MQKSAEGLTTEVAALEMRQATLKAQVHQLMRGVSLQSDEDVTLSQLEREAQVNRDVYKAMLIRVKQLAAEQRIERGNSEIAIPATPPSYPSYPRKKLLIAGRGFPL